MTIIGIDPGSRHFGYGIIDSEKMKLIDAATINIPLSMSLPGKLKYIYDLLSEVIDRHNPCEMAVEKIFAGKKNSFFIYSWIYKGSSSFSGSSKKYICL